MTIRTEVALDALAAALADVPGLPDVQRDARLPGAFDQDENGVGRWLCLRRGDGRVSSQLLGTDTPTGSTYEIDHVAELEWLCEHADRATRNAVWRSGIEAIAAAIAADKTLGGAVDDCEIEGADFASLTTQGIPEIEAVSLPIRLTFTSDYPF